MQQEEMQEQMNGEDEARRERETHRKGNRNRRSSGESEKEMEREGKGDDKWRGVKSRRNNQTRRKRTRRNWDSEGLGGLVARQRSGMDERGMERVER